MRPSRRRCLLPAVLAAAGCDPSGPATATITVEYAEDAGFVLDTLEMFATVTAGGRPAPGVALSATTWQLAWNGTGRERILEHDLGEAVTDSEGRVLLTMVPATGDSHYVAVAAAMVADTARVYVDAPPPVGVLGQWSRLPDLPIAASFVGSAAHGGRVYVAGYFLAAHFGAHIRGCPDLCTIGGATYAYDIASAAWSAGAPPPPHDTLFAAVDRDTYDPGRVAASAAGVHLLFGPFHHVYDAETGAWEDRAPPPFDAQAGTFTAVGDTLVLVGADGAVALYAPATDTWTWGSRLFDRTRPWAAAAAADGQLYLAGGGPLWTGGDGFDRYDPSTDTWIELPAMPLRRTAFGAGTLGGSICVFGGGFPMSRNGYVFPETHCYAPPTGTWSAGPTLPVQRLSLTSQDVGLMAISAVSRNDTTYVVGGESGGLQARASAAAVFTLTAPPWPAPGAWFR